jgi:putative transposase
MDGRGAGRENVFVARLWKSVTYERVYVSAYDSVTEAGISLMPYMDWDNPSSPHSSLGKHTSHAAYAS